jgi:uncharacterized protein (TIGR03437 family)
MLMVGLSFCPVGGAEAADLIVSPAALRFGVTGGATLTIPQQFDVNSTGGPITFTVSSSSAGNWLTVIGSTPLANRSWQAATPFSIGVFVDATGLSPGNYSGTITVSAASAANSPQTVTVSLSVGSPPAITANPASLSFTAQSGDSRSATKSIAVSISQPSQLDFTATAVGGDWVSVNYLSGTLPGSINAVVNPVGLAPGSYSASIFISIVGASNSPLTVPVALTVANPTPPSITGLTPGSATAGGPALTLTVNGTGILSGDAVQWNGSPLLTKFVSASQLTASVPASLIAVQGKASITILRQGMPSSVAFPFSVIDPALPAISQNGIVPIYSSTSVIQSGSWVSIYGTNLASDVFTWGGNFPTLLGDVTVTVDGKSAYLWFVSPTQINLQAPDDTATGTVPVVVTTAKGKALSTVTLGEFAPSFCVVSGKYVAGIILRSDGSGEQGEGTYDFIGPDGSSLGYPTKPVRAGDSIELFGVGFGPTTPSMPAGMAVPLGAYSTAESPIRFLVNGVSVAPSFAGITEAGLFQNELNRTAGSWNGRYSHNGNRWRCADALWCRNFRELSRTSISFEVLVRVESEILQITPSRSKPNQAIVTVKSITLNQNAEEVQLLTSKILMYMRPLADNVR